MSCLLDTHILLWWVLADRRLPQRARTLIQNVEVKVQVSVVSLWEIAIKAPLKRVAVDANELYQAILDSDFGLLPIGPRHALAVSSLPPLHGDPFDRMLVAQAKAEQLTLLTHDKILSIYGQEIELV